MGLLFEHHLPLLEAEAWSELLGFFFYLPYLNISTAGNTNDYGRIYYKYKASMQSVNREKVLVIQGDATEGKGEAV